MTARPLPDRSVDRFDIEVDGSSVVVHGDLDVVTAPRLASALDDARRRGLPLIVDAGDIDVFTAAATHVLRSVSSDLDCGQIMIRRATPTVRCVLEIVELAHLLDDHSTTEPTRRKRHAARAASLNSYAPSSA